MADKDRDGKLTFSELRQILWEGSKEYSHLAEHARFLDGCDQKLRASSLTYLPVACGLHASVQTILFMQELLCEARSLMAALQRDRCTAAKCRPVSSGRYTKTHC